ncbi:Hypothetical protein D9617_17g047900 [Elsinoe fawcettii]|nr:Hypothetical protein D9617_17g047900 [Elsinoe fawcettii]
MVMKHCTSFEEVAEAEADMITREQQSKSVRSTLTISGRHRSAAEAKAIDEIATPNTMTIISFANYVNSLTIARPSRLKLRHGSTWGHSVNNFGDHIERVANILVALFKTKKLRPCWSSTAAIRTLQFLGKHRMFPKSRELLLELSKVKYYRQFRTYEGFLEATSVAYDLKNFQYGVEVMIRQGIAPSPRIWAQFLRIVAKYDYSAGQIVLKAMRSHHLLESPAARIEALEQVALPEYEMWIDRSGSFATFLNYLRREWQLEYISESVIGRLLPYHLHRAQWKEAETLMHHAMSRGRFVESSHLSMCLKNAARHGDPEAAVRFCKLCLPFSSMDREGFRELFSLVWHRQYLCMLNVVWRFGCLHGHISYEMESLMRGSLLRAPNASDDLSTVTSKTDSELAAPAPVPGTFHLSLLKDLVSSASLRHGIFERIAAVNAIGLGLGVVDGKRTMQVGSKIPAYMTKQERLKIMEQDMATGRQYHAQIPFEDILEEAYQRDLEMKRGGLPNNLPAITAMCPQVPVIERSDTMSSIGADDKARSADFYSSVSEALKEPKDKQAKK